MRISNAKNMVCVALLVLLCGASAQADPGYALRFFRQSRPEDIDRVKVRIEGENNSVNVGVGDFTIEWWMKAQAEDNPEGPVSGGGHSWIYGNIIIDNDIFGSGDYGDYGISLGGGRVAFGVARSNNGNTLSGMSNVTDGNWHHVAVTRRASDGQLSIFVDGLLDAQDWGPSGNAGYRTGRSTSYPSKSPS